MLERIRRDRGRQDRSHKLRETVPRWEKRQKHHVGLSWLAWTTSMVSLIVPEMPLCLEALVIVGTSRDDKSLDTAVACDEKSLDIAAAFTPETSD
jgi:hypothetical protein